MGDHGPIVTGSPYRNITEMTLITPIIEGHAEELAQVLAGVQIADDSPIKRISTIHYARWVIIDDGARLLFTSNFDGTWEKYMRDFSEKIPEGLDGIWGHCVGWPGAQPFEPFREWVLAHQITANLFYAAYPESTVREVLKALDWKSKTEHFTAELAKPRARSESVTMRELRDNLGDIQGNILHAYHLPVARYFFCEIDGATAGREWLGLLSERVTDATIWKADEKPDSTLNISLSFEGLRALGLSRRSLESFPEEFRVGMAARAELLGDEGESAPDEWEEAFQSSRLHVLVAVNARTPESLEAETTWLRNALDRIDGVSTAYVQDAALPATGTEHFGFADGISQPSIAGSGFREYPGQGTPVESGKWKALEPGEFVIGYPAEDGLVASGPTPDALGVNGTFLVFRKLHQRVAAFREFLRTTASSLWSTEDPAKVELLAAKLVGRWRSGCPLELSPESDDLSIAHNPQINNNFRYAQDPDGDRCPVGAHIRRANPRGSLDQTDTLVRRHRIMRRGLPYGPWLDADVDDGVDRGLVFMAVNSSIRRQYEFVQEEWINKGDFFYLDGEKDPLVGANDGTGRMTLPGPGLPFVFNLPRFVTTRGGEYFFVPGVSALRGMAQGKF